MANEIFVIESTLPATEAFSRVIDLTHVSQWDQGVTNPLLIGGTPGAVDARYEVTVTGFDGQPTTAVYELTAVDSPRSFTMTGTNANFQANDTVTIKPTANGCQVTYDAGLVFRGDNPPMSNAQLDAVFKKIVAVPQAGLAAFLNPEPVAPLTT